ncbi:MAG TPA: hypothetical protein VJB14_03340, partial [Planctomycetota bacterium]|nr:hypothetical protein [Planctomycetota bacterium]
MGRRNAYLAVVLAVAAFCGFSSLQAGKTWRAVGAVQPRISPDGASIAFAYQGAIWRVPREGGLMRRLTSGKGFDGEPAWSPDGRMILFADA